MGQVGGYTIWGGAWGQKWGVGGLDGVIGSVVAAGAKTLGQVAGTPLPTSPPSVLSPTIQTPSSSTHFSYFIQLLSMRWISYLYNCNLKNVWLAFKEVQQHQSSWWRIPSTFLMSVFLELLILLFKLWFYFSQRLERRWQILFSQIMKRGRVVSFGCTNVRSVTSWPLNSHWHTDCHTAHNSHLVMRGHFFYFGIFHFWAFWHSNFLWLFCKYIQHIIFYKCTQGLWLAVQFRL